MSQDQVIKILLKCRNPLTSKEIAKRMGISHPNTSKNIRGLIHQRIIVAKKTKNNFCTRPIFVYELKR